MKVAIYKKNSHVTTFDKYLLDTLMISKCRLKCTWKPSLPSILMIVCKRAWELLHVDKCMFTTDHCILLLQIQTGTQRTAIESMIHESLFIFTHVYKQMSKFIETYVRLSCVNECLVIIIHVCGSVEGHVGITIS